MQVDMDELVAHQQIPRRRLTLSRRRNKRCLYQMMRWKKRAGVLYTWLIPATAMRVSGSLCTVSIVTSMVPLGKIQP